MLFIDILLKEKKSTKFLFKHDSRFTSSQLQQPSISINGPGTQPLGESRNEELLTDKLT